MTGEPQVTPPEAIIVRSYEVHAAVLFGPHHPDGQGAVVLRLTGICNETGEPITVTATVPPEESLMLARDLRAGFQRVPLDKRHGS